MHLDGGNLAKAVAYHARISTTCPVTGRKFDFGKRRDWLAGGIEHPAGLAGNPPDRETTWRVIRERARSNQRLIAYNLIVGLPLADELSVDELCALMESFAAPIVTAGHTVDWNIHSGKENVRHAHVLISSGMLTAVGRVLPLPESPYRSSVRRNGDKLLHFGPNWPRIWRGVQEQFFAERLIDLRVPAVAYVVEESDSTQDLAEEGSSQDEDLAADPELKASFEEARAIETGVAPARNPTEAEGTPQTESGLSNKTGVEVEKRNRPLFIEEIERKRYRRREYFSNHHHVLAAMTRSRFAFDRSELRSFVKMVWKSDKPDLDRRIEEILENALRIENWSFPTSASGVPSDVGNVVSVAAKFQVSEKFSTQDAWTTLQQAVENAEILHSRGFPTADHEGVDGDWDPLKGQVKSSCLSVMLAEHREAFLKSTADTDELGGGLIRVLCSYLDRVGLVVLHHDHQSYERISSLAKFNEVTIRSVHWFLAQKKERSDPQLVVLVDAQRLRDIDLAELLAATAHSDDKLTCMVDLSDLRSTQGEGLWAHLVHEYHVGRMFEVGNADHARFATGSSSPWNCLVSGLPWLAAEKLRILTARDLLHFSDDSPSVTVGWDASEAKSRTSDEDEFLPNQDNDSLDSDHGIDPDVEVRFEQASPSQDATAPRNLETTASAEGAFGTAAARTDVTTDKNSTSAQNHGGQSAGFSDFEVKRGDKAEQNSEDTLGLLKIIVTGTEADVASHPNFNLPDKEVCDDGSDPLDSGGARIQVDLWMIANATIASDAADAKSDRYPAIAQGSLGRVVEVDARTGSLTLVFDDGVERTLTWKNANKLASAAVIPLRMACLLIDRRKALRSKSATLPTIQIVIEIRSSHSTAALLAFAIEQNAAPVSVDENVAGSYTELLEVVMQQSPAAVFNAVARGEGRFLARNPVVSPDQLSERRTSFDTRDADSPTPAAASSDRHQNISEPELSSNSTQTFDRSDEMGDDVPNDPTNQLAEVHADDYEDDYADAPSIEDAEDLAARSIADAESDSEPDFGDDDRTDEEHGNDHDGPDEDADSDDFDVKHD